MATKLRKSASIDTSNNGKKVMEYVVSESPLDFYVSEQTASYCQGAFKHGGVQYTGGWKNG